MLALVLRARSVGGLDAALLAHVQKLTLSVLPLGALIGGGHMPGPSSVKGYRTESTQMIGFSEESQW